MRTDAPLSERRGSVPRREAAALRPIASRAIALAIALIAVAGPTGAAEKTDVAAQGEKPVALPPFIVEEASKGPPWRYAEAMGYEILSRCDDRVTRRVVEAHVNLHHLLSEILPPQFHVKMSVPRQLILYDSELQPAASQEVIARMLKRQPDLPPPEDLPMPGGRGFRVPASVSRVSFLPNLRLWDRDSMAVFMIVRRDDFDAERLSLTHDYVTFLVRTRMPALPPWFVQGFLALHQETTYGGGRLELAPLTWISRQHTDALKKDPKTAPPVTPLADFFSNRFARNDPIPMDDPVKAWVSQAALFVRWGSDPNQEGRRAALWKFAERCAIEGASEPLFVECFGFDYAEAHAQLTAYLPQAVRRSVYYRPKAAKMEPLPLRNASDGQIARMKGDWERLEIPYVRAISPELAPKYLEQARRTLKRGYDRGERDPRLLAVMGLCECEAGDEAAAREYLEAAVAIGPIRPRANCELARLRLAAYRKQPEGARGGLSIAQTADVLRPLFAARETDPPLPEVYELIAEAWNCSDATPNRGHLAVLHEGVRWFPRRINLVLSAAELDVRHGFTDDAMVFVELAARIADDDASRQRVAVLRQKLQIDERKPEFGDRKPDAGNRKPEAGDRSLETGNRNLD